MIRLRFIGSNEDNYYSPRKGYGHHREEMVLTVERDTIPAHINPQLGQQLGLHYDNDQKMTVIITETSDYAVTLDGNHPLAGRDLTFKIQLAEIE